MREKGRPHGHYVKKAHTTGEDVIHVAMTWTKKKNSGAPWAKTESTVGERIMEVYRTNTVTTVRPVERKAAMTHEVQKSRPIVERGGVQARLKGPGCSNGGRIKKASRKEEKKRKGFHGQLSQKILMEWHMR